MGIKFFDVLEIMSKINNIRSAYRHKVKKCYTSNKSCTSVDSIYKVVWLKSVD